MVVVEITPDWEGRLEGFNVVSGPPELAKHVIRSVSTWHYAERVGDTKPRRVSINFNLAQAISPFSDSGAAPQVVDNLSNEFRVSSRNRSFGFKLKTLAVMGLSEDETRKLIAFLGTAKIREGDEVTVDQLYDLRSVAANFDHDLRTYFLRAQSDITATIAPVGFVAGDLGDEPPIQTTRVPPGAAPGRIQVSATEQARRLISKVEPEYPSVAKANHIQGVVRVRITIGEDGRVLNVEVRGGQPLLYSAAEEAVAQWIYSPAEVNGRAVEVITEADVEFYLIQ